MYLINLDSHCEDYVSVMDTRDTMVLRIIKRGFRSNISIGTPQLYVLPHRLGLRISRAEILTTDQHIRNYSVLNSSALNHSCSKFAKVYIPSLRPLYLNLSNVVYISSLHVKFTSLVFFLNESLYVIYIASLHFKFTSLVFFLNKSFLCRLHLKFTSLVFFLNEMLCVVYIATLHFMFTSLYFS